jgi:hypothetical protein
VPFGIHHNYLYSAERQAKTAALIGAVPYSTLQTTLRPFLAFYLSKRLTASREQAGSNPKSLRPLSAERGLMASKSLFFYTFLPLDCIFELLFKKFSPKALATVLIPGRYFCTKIGHQRGENPAPESLPPIAQHLLYARLLLTGHRRDVFLSSGGAL